MCLATQSSLERLFSLVQVSHQWAGPISVALFLASPDELKIARAYVKFIRLCYATVREKVRQEKKITSVDVFADIIMIFKANSFGIHFSAVFSISVFRIYRFNFQLFPILFFLSQMHYLKLII